VIILLMGPAGSGKTVVGHELAAQLGWAFLDGDDFHSPSNRLKMAQGNPLNDEDRLPWLESIHESLLNTSKRGESLILGCSALKHAYREMLCKDLDMKIVYLQGSREVLLDRLKERKGHFFREELLNSQLADLEEPEASLTLDVRLQPTQLVHQILEELNLK
jgi:gluconokinase